MNALDLYLSMMYWRSLGTFSGVGAQGRTAGVSGGSSLLGQEQVSDDDVGTPELEQLGLLGVDIDRMEAVGGKLSHSPTSGKEEGTRPRSTQADRERKVELTCLEM